MRLIDADALVEQIKKETEELANSDPFLVGLLVAEEYIDEAPMVEPERKKGKWILPNDCVALYLDEWICSNCAHLISHRHNFCPNCGADMREEKDDELK